SPRNPSYVGQTHAVLRGGGFGRVEGAECGGAFVASGSAAGEVGLGVFILLRHTHTTFPTDRSRLQSDSTFSAVSSVPAVSTASVPTPSSPPPFPGNW